MMEGMLGLILFVAFVVVPIAEVVLILQVSDLIGGWETAALLLAEMVLGGWIVRREGRRAWQALSSALLRGVMPDRELSDAALVLVGGTLLLTPGFLSDVVGFFFVLPPTRPLVRRLLASYVERRVQMAHSRMGVPHDLFRGDDPHGGGPGSAGDGAASGTPRRVIRGEVIEDDGGKEP